MFVANAAWVLAVIQLDAAQNRERHGLLAHAKGVGALLGLTELHGGRHLHASIDARTHAWRKLAQTLDSNLLTDDQGTEVVAGACLAYHRLDQLLSLALGKLT